jgi:hypothetical protein
MIFIEDENDPVSSHSGVQLGQNRPANATPEGCGGREDAGGTGGVELQIDWRCKEHTERIACLDRGSKGRRENTLREHHLLYKFKIKISKNQFLY